VLCSALLPALLHPAQAASDAPKRGAEVFATHGCIFCHGPQLAGTERAPKIADVRKRLKPDQIEHQIHDGGKGMPAFGEQLQPEEIADLVAFLRTKHPEKLLPPPAAKPVQQ
jgi:mono/diheme cytochrome c family protein